MPHRDMSESSEEEKELMIPTPVTASTILSKQVDDLPAPKELGVYTIEAASSEPPKEFNSIVIQTDSFQTSDFSMQTTPIVQTQGISVGTYHSLTMVSTECQTSAP